MDLMSSFKRRSYPSRYTDQRSRELSRSSQRRFGFSTMTLTKISASCLIVLSVMILLSLIFHRDPSDHLVGFADARILDGRDRLNVSLPTVDQIPTPLTYLKVTDLLPVAQHSLAVNMDVGSSSCNMEQEVERRRVWTSSETEALLDALEDVIARGGQSDNGTFRAGALKQVEQMLAAKLPGCTLKANPHIESKMKKLKKDYSIVFDMLNTSGFGWNDLLKCVQVDSDSVWNSYVQHHPTARGWRNKPFPYYERLSRIFGRDRATGRAAETPAEMEAHDSETRESFEELGDEIPPPSFNEPPRTGTSNQSTSSSRKRKREDPLAGGLEKMGATLEKLVETITNQRAHEYASIQEEVGKLDDTLNEMGYNTYDRVRLLNLFVDQPTKMALFKGLKSEEARQQFVLTLLSML